MLAVTVIKLLQASVKIVKSSFKYMYSLGKVDFDMFTRNTFDTYDFLLRGVYTWCLLSLTISRILVLKNANVVQNPKTRFQILQISLTLSITLNIVATIACGIVLFLVSPVHTSQACIIKKKKTLKFIIMDVSWMFVIILNLVLAVYITVVFVRTYPCRIRQYKFNDKSTHKHMKKKENVSRRRLPGLSSTQVVIPRTIHKGYRSASRKLLRHVLMSVILLLIFNIAQSTEDQMFQQKSPHNCRP